MTITALPPVAAGHQADEVAQGYPLGAAVSVPASSFQPVLWPW